MSDSGTAPTDARNEMRPTETNTEAEVIKKELSPAMRTEPLHEKGDKFNKIVSGEQSETDTEQSESESEDNKIIHRETALSTNEIMENYNKIIDEFYKNNDVEKTFKRIRYLTMMIPDNKFDEVAETEAATLAQMNINGVKLFKDIQEALQFLYDLRYGRKGTFKGQHQKVYKLPKLQKMIKQSEQAKQTISLMMLRNLKPLTKTNNIYEY